MLPKSEVNERKWSETSTNVTDFQVATKARPAGVARGRRSLVFGCVNDMGVGKVLGMFYLLACLLCDEIMVIEFVTGKIKMGSKSNRPLPTHRIVKGNYIPYRTNHVVKHKVR